jgi:hypothetical protein
LRGNEKGFHCGKDVPKVGRRQSAGSSESPRLRLA